MSNTLLLHLGTAKTGTTAIQEFLRLNQDRIKEQGWVYPDLYRDFYGESERFEITTGAAMPNGMILYYVTHSRNIYKDIIWRKIKHYLKTRNVIISCESMFDNLDGVSLYNRLADYKRRYSNIKVVVYLRRQDLWIESAWNQAIEGNYFGENIQSFIMKYPRASESPDYLIKLKEIERAIGRDNIVLRVYEKGQLEGDKGDSISDFACVLQRLGCNIQIQDAIMPKHTNPRLTDDVLSFALLFNSEYCKNTYRSSVEVQELFMRMNELSLASGGRMGGYLKEGERMTILKRYQKCNETIAREYLHREEGTLFYDSNLGYEFWSPRDYSDEERRQILLYARQMGKLMLRVAEEEDKAVIERKADMVRKLIKGFMTTLD